MTTDSAARPRVLFVDDEPRILFTLKALFRNDYQVTLAHSGADAVEFLKSNEIDIVVSDQRMPRMTGIEVLRAARELRPRAVRMLLTGYSDLNAIIGSINEGEIFRFINKPWTNDELRATLAQAAEAAKIEQAAEPAAEVETPVADEPTAQPVTAAAADSAPTGVGVLVLDNDPSTRDELRRVLGANHPIYVAESMEQCVAVLEQNRDVGVIVSETTVDGQPVTPMLTTLRQNQPALVMIVMTAEADALQMVSLINHSQIYRFMQKPANASVLRGTVNLAIRRSEILRNNPVQAARLPAAAAPPPSKAMETSGLLGRLKRLFAA